MEIARPQLPAEPETAADPIRMHLDEEIADAVFRGADFGAPVREHLSVQGCRFTGCVFAGSALGHSQFSDFSATATFRTPICWDAVSIAWSSPTAS